MKKNIDITGRGLPERLRELRQARNITKADLADQSGLAFRTIHDLENGRRDRVLEKTLVLLADALEIDYDELLNGSRPDASADHATHPRNRWSRRVAVYAVMLAITGATALLYWTSGHRSSPRPKYVTTSSPDALHHYLDGVKALERLHREEAKASFHEALACDSTFVMAHIRLTSPQLMTNRRDGLAHLKQAERYSPGASTVERLYVRSRRAYLEHDLTTAVAVLETLVTEAPDQYDAYTLAGSCLSLQGDHAGAILKYRAALEIAPDYGRVYNRLAYAYDAVGDTEWALWAAERYLELAPHEVNPYDTKGDLLARNGRPEEAIVSYRRALELKTNFYPSIQSLGILHLLNCDYETAESYFRELTLARDGGARGRGRFFLAGMHVYRGALDDALIVLDNSIAADALDGQMADDLCHKYLLKAEVLLELNEPDQAVAASQQMLATARSIGQVWLPEWYDDHAYVLMRAGRRAEAVAVLDTIQAHLPQHDSAQSGYYWFAKGWIDFISGDSTSAVAAFKLAYDLEPIFAHGYSWALASLEAGNLEGASVVFDGLLSSYGADRVTRPLWAAKAYFYGGVAHEGAGRTERAAELYGRFISTWAGAHPAHSKIVRDAEVRLSSIRGEVSDTAAD